MASKRIKDFNEATAVANTDFFVIDNDTGTFKVSKNLVLSDVTTAIANLEASLSNHNHNDVYYTETEIDALLDGLGGGTINGTDTQILYFDGNDTPHGDPNFVWNKSNKKVTITATGNADSLVIQSGATDYYSPKLKLIRNPSSFMGTLMVDYEGSLLFTATSFKYAKFGNLGANANVRIQTYSYGVNAAPNNFVLEASAPTIQAIPFVAKGKAGQTGNLQEWRDSNNIALSSISSFGAFVTSQNIEVTDNLSGIILKSPNNTRWQVTVNDSGNLVTTSL